MKINLNYKILVLNRLWQAVNVVGVQRGFSLLLQDNAQVIYTSDQSYRLMNADAWLALSQEMQDAGESPEECIQTIRLKILLPKVLLLRSYSQVPIHEVKFSRENLLDRDDYRCQYCGNQLEPALLNMDHVIPRDQGGKTSWENIVTSCIKCNSKKANRLPHQANMSLIKKPERPRWRPFISSLIGHSYEKDWEHFLNLNQAAR